MQTLGYESCKADADLWFKRMVRPDDGFEYYAYILLYVDDCLCIHHDAEDALRQLDKFFKMKAGSIGDPDLYLSAKLKYVTEAVRNVEVYLGKNFGRGTQAEEKSASTMATQLRIQYGSIIRTKPRFGFLLPVTDWSSALDG